MRRPPPHGPVHAGVCAPQVLSYVPTEEARAQVERRRQVIVLGPLLRLLVIREALDGGGWVGPRSGWIRGREGEFRRPTRGGR